MKKFLLMILALAVFAACEKTDPVADMDQAGLTVKSQEMTGNGMPSGAHYNLNIIGVPKAKNAAMDDNDGHRIFVPLETNKPVKIWLVEGPEFDVLDANGTDNNGAKFQLPNPVADGITGPLAKDDIAVTKYTVFARALGKPFGKAQIVTCADSVLNEGNYQWMELTCGDTLKVERTKGKPKAINATRELLFVTIMENILIDDMGNDDPSDDLILEAGNYPLFDDALAGYFWEYDNAGLKLLQLRFYPIEDEVTFLYP